MAEAETLLACRSLDPGDHLILDVQNRLRGRFPVIRAIAAKAELGQLAAGETGHHQRYLVGGKINGHATCFLWKRPALAHRANAVTSQAGASHLRHAAHPSLVFAACLHSEAGTGHSSSTT
jgi:hypothetical protein